MMNQKTKTILRLRAVMNRPLHIAQIRGIGSCGITIGDLLTVLNCQDHRTLCEWVKYYFLCAVRGTEDDILEIVYTFDELCVI